MNLKKWVQKFLRKFVEPEIVEKAVVFDKQKQIAEESLRNFAKHTEARYGITYEDLIGDFNPGKFHDKSEEMFWERYVNPTHYTEAPYAAREYASTYSAITRQEINKWREEAKKKIDDLKKKFGSALKRAYQELEKEL